MSFERLTEIKKHELKRIKEFQKSLILNFLNRFGNLAGNLSNTKIGENTLKKLYKVLFDMGMYGFIRNLGPNSEKLQQFNKKFIKDLWGKKRDALSGNEIDKKQLEYIEKYINKAIKSADKDTLDPVVTFKIMQLIFGKRKLFPGWGKEKEEGDAFYHLEYRKKNKYCDIGKYGKDIRLFHEDEGVDLDTFVDFLLKISAEEKYGRYIYSESRLYNKEFINGFLERTSKKDSKIKGLQRILEKIATFTEKRGKTPEWFIKKGSKMSEFKGEYEETSGGPLRDQGIVINLKRLHELYEDYTKEKAKNDLEFTERLLNRSEKVKGDCKKNV